MNGNISIEFHQDIGGVDVLIASAEWSCVPRVGEVVCIRLNPHDEQTTLLTVIEVSWGWRVRTLRHTPEHPDQEGCVESIPQECVAIVTVGEVGPKIDEVKFDKSPHDPPTGWIAEKLRDASDAGFAGLLPSGQLRTLHHAIDGGWRKGWRAAIDHVIERIKEARNG